VRYQLAVVIKIEWRIACASPEEQITPVARFRRRAERAARTDRSDPPVEAAP
jgi:hypothetical protein